VQPAKQAIIRDDVFYACNDFPTRAPYGVYALDVGGDSRVAFHCCATDTHFSLSLDMVLQHVCEGRMLLVA